MVSEDNINELLEQLEKLGFPKSMEEKLHGQIAKRLADFSVHHTEEFREEKMEFNLYFHQDMEKNTVQLLACDAFHCDPVPIEDVTVNGVNTSQLEEKMKMVDWELYFDDALPDSLVKDYARSVLDDLWKLSFNDDKNGGDLQKKLEYKYFPQSQWSMEAERLSYVFQSYTKKYYSFDDWNIHLCYMEMSGRYSNLLDALSQIRLQEVYTGYTEQLRSEIMEGKKEFDIRVSYDRPDGLAEINIPIRQTDDAYGIDMYTVEYTPLPEIKHGVYNNVDTKLLEEQMRQINWRDDGALFIFREDEEPKIKSEPALVSEQLFHLSKDLVGADIADLLQLKYFIGVTFFEDNIHQTAWDTLEELPKRTVAFNASTPVREALSLIAGRTVFMGNRDVLSDNNDWWIRYIFDENQKYNHTEIVKDYPVRALEQQLKMLMPTTFLPNVKKQLLFGETAETRSHAGNQIFVRADPKNKTLRVFDKDKKEIAFNFRLDADWQPKIEQVY